MVKIRVYELARELDMTNKDLVKKIRDMGIAVKAHMCSLDDESVARIKTEILSNKIEIGTSNKSIKMIKPVKSDLTGPTDIIARFKAKMLNKETKMAPEESRIKPSISDKRKKRATKTLEALINRRKSCITQPDLTEAKKDLKEQSIKISEGDTGYTYEKLFGEYLKGAKRITIQDAFIRTKHQIQNFIRFCELLVKIGDTKQISLITKYKDKNQIETLSMLKNSLIKYGIEFEYKFRETLHDRQIKLDNGWIIEVGRGLDIYQRLENWFSIGSSNFDFRPCKETNVRFAKYKGTYSNHQ